MSIKGTTVNISGILSVGNGEKCPFCETIITKDIDTFKHLADNHPDELNKALWPHKK